ncbi:MAG: EAL domain-containing protein [Sulfurimicrobium sp.]|nr:EAL domain-containing protein [Sulfurimicrobium sp.]
MEQFNWLPLIEGMIEAVWLVDPINLRIVATNRSAESLLRVAPGSLVGTPVIDLAATPEDVFFWEDVAAGLAEKIFSETLLLRQDGTSIQVERRVTRVQFGQEGPLYIVAIRDKSEQRRVENELEQLIAELRATLESTADGILVANMEGAIRAYNYRFSELWDLPDDLLTRRDDPAVYAWMKQCMLDSEHYAERLGIISRSPLLEATDILALRSGRVLERVTLPQYARGRPIGRVYSYRDITQRLADEARLQLASKVFEASLDAIFVTDAEYRIIAANPSCERLTGYAREEILGLLPEDFIYDLGNESSPEQMKARLSMEGVWQGELWHRRKDGNSCPCLVSMVRVPDESGNTLHTIGFFKDLTESLAAKQRIEELAYSDTLTGLPNRLMLAERMELTLGYAKRNGESFAVLFLDLDHFKQINDSLGHMFGDRVLIEVAERLKSCLCQADMASRLGGDEFVLLISHADARGAEITARCVLDALTKPFTLDDIHFTVTCSIGIALYPDDGITIDDLIKNSDSAMYHVKERGRSDFRFYQRQMNIGLLSRMKLDHAMRQALEHGDFKLHYQPQVDLGSGRIFGAEALIRWHDKELGQISPAQFIPVAEETGVIVAIGNWVLTQAVQQAALWHAQGKQLVMAVNVSALQFQQANFVASVAEALNAAALPPGRLELELTESILVRDADDALKRLEALAELGVRLAIDDFGTGYSSLSYLKRFPIHKLKIDRSFICGLPGDDSDVAIAFAIINLAQALKLRVIAEGVETEAQRAFLTSTGCQEFQGFLCSPAVDAEAFERLLAEQEP